MTCVAHQHRQAAAGRCRTGDSICTNGACLTVVELPGDGYWADVSTETLNFTTSVISGRVPG